MHLESASPLAASTVLWEASERVWGSLDAHRAEGLISSVQNGANLILTLDSLPGLTPLLLGSMLPTTGWTTQLRRSAFSGVETASVESIDPTFFNDRLSGLVIPFYFDIRPVPAVERGQARYERYSFVHPLLHTAIAANSDFWSRPLINREWKLRARLNNLAQWPLLVTGRFGAGKVAVLATSASSLGDSSAARNFWGSVFRWVQSSDEAGDAVAPSLELSVAAVEHTATVTAINRGTATARTQLVVRATATDGAMLADGAGEHIESVEIGGGQTVERKVRIDAPTESMDESGNRMPLRFHVGLISASGDIVIAERRVLAAPAPIHLRIETDNLHGFVYPFHSPGPEAIGSFQGRMGASAGAYAYAPGQVLNGAVFVSNGVENLAPLATIQDLTTAGNPSVMALNDDATGMRLQPNYDKIKAYSMWTGKAGTENALRFEFPEGWRISAVVIVGSYGKFGNGSLHNPARAIIELDGETVGANVDLDAEFVAGYGQARIAFSPRRAKQVAIRLPWVAEQSGRPRQEPWLGEIRVEGWRLASSAPVSGKLAVNLVDALSGEKTPILNVEISLAECASLRKPYSVRLSEQPGIRFYRIEAEFLNEQCIAPVLTITPAKTLLPMTDLHPANCAGIGFNVSKGFREVFQRGTGTAESHSSWESPDDLIWSYSRQLKKVQANAPSGATRLYTSLSDMRHYITPWCSFLNGEQFMPVAAPLIAENLKKDPKWKASDIAVLTFADGWDTGPDLATMHGWQVYVEFDKHLRATIGHGLAAQTHKQAGAEIESKFPDEWHAWQLSCYLTSVRSLREAFQAEGKQLVITAQGVPMVAGDAGHELALTIRGMSDDFTWGMLDNSTVFTTGRQMGELAFNPAWQMSTLSPWGHNSSLTNNWQWHNPVGTTEPSRRNLYDRAWRGIVDSDGRYRSQYVWGFASNVGIAYTMTEADFQQWWNVQERQSLIYPEEPIGAGLVVSTSKPADPKQLRFTCGDALSMHEARLTALAFQSLHCAGIDISFSANAEALGKYSFHAPLIVLNLPDFSADELSALKAIHARGVAMVAFAKESDLSEEARELFSRPRALILEAQADQLGRSEALSVAEQTHGALSQLITFPPGTAGYGFRCQGLTFVVLEDWLEQARPIQVSIAKSNHAVSATACNANDHRTLHVQDGGAEWIVHLAVRSADGVLIAFMETIRES